jgi:hypothetical protein
MVLKPAPDRQWLMAEDSGAFKTNQAKSRLFPRFVMDLTASVAGKPHRSGKHPPLNRAANRPGNF